MGDSLQERMGKRVKELRARKLLTLEELGKLADMKPGTISQFERGVRKAQARTAKRLAQALGVTPEIPFLLLIHRALTILRRTRKALLE